MSKIKVNDLRSALELLETIPRQLIETDVEVHPHAQLSGVYCHVGAGRMVMRPTKEGPAIIFNHVRVCVCMIRYVSVAFMWMDYPLSIFRFYMRGAASYWRRFYSPYNQL